MVTEQLESDIEAAEKEIEDAIASQEKSKLERQALEETLRVQQVCISGLIDMKGS